MFYGSSVNVQKFGQIEQVEQIEQIEQVEQIERFCAYNSCIF